MANRWSILAVLFFGRMAMAFQFQAVAALAPLIEDSYGASLADIGLLIGLYFAPGIAFAIPGSALATRLGERRVVVAAMILMLLGGALMWTGTGWAALVSGRLVAGIGGAIINVLLTKLLADWFVGREISTAMAVFVNSWPVGIALALLVMPHAATGGLAPAWGTVLLLIAAALVLFILGHRPPDRGASVAHVVGTHRLPLGAVVLAGWVWAFYNAAIGMVFSFGPVLLVARGRTLAAASSATSLYLVLMAISVPLGGIIADRTGRRDAVIAASLAGFAILLAAIVWAPVGWVPATFVVMGLISGLAAGPVMGLPSLVLSPEARAYGMGVFVTIYYAVFMVAPMFAGWLADLVGDAAMPFMLGMLMLLSCLAALWWFRRVAEAATATTAR